MYSFPMVKVTADTRYGSERIGISRDLAKQLFLENNGELMIHIGKLSHTVKVTIKGSDAAPTNLLMHPSVLRKLYLQSGREYGFKTGTGKIRIGPVVGVMIDVLGGMTRPFAGQTTFARQLLTFGREIGILCYAFSPNSVNWQRKVISGYTFGSQGWKKQIFPFPDVVYPRERPTSRSKHLIRGRLAALGVTLLNPIVIGKWEAHKVISDNPALKPYLPDTKLLTKFEQVDQMVRNYQAVYLKPIAGSKGQNIIRIARHKRAVGYHYQYEKNKRSVQGYANNIQQLHSALRPVMGGRQYIAQKQINLIKTNGHLIDVRVLVQKDHTGEWDVTGIACRMGKKGAITSNISAGGSGEKLSSVLSEHFQEIKQQKQIEQEIRYLALESARLLEKTIGRAGEMGIDVGIDERGKTWFIEANLRPARYVFNLIGDTNTRMKSVRNPMLYSRYLAGFQEGSSAI